MASLQPPANTGDAQGPSAAPRADVIYGFESLGRRWSGRETSQQRFPPGCAN